MFIAGTIAGQVAFLFGLMATAIAVCGFLAHAGPALSGADERRVREATVEGGLAGLVLSVFVVVLSALMS
ncbi:MAG TPA: hypothetical protein VN752_01655 [Solirubrobacterales bacterium]|nr:hypothetical protein [Solirubrobacterales bacterium]